MADRYINNAAVGAGNGLTKADAYTSIVTALAAEGDGQRYLFSHTHVENFSADTDVQFSTDKANPDHIVSINFSDDTVTPGAKINTNGNFRLTINGSLRSDEVTLEAGAGGASSAILLRHGLDGDCEQVYRGGTVYLNSTSVSSYFFVGSSGGTETAMRVRYKGVTIRKGHADQFFYFRDGNLEIDGMTVHASSADAPSDGLFRGLVDNGRVLVNDSDLSNFGASWAVVNGVTGGIQVEMNRVTTAASWGRTLSAAGSSDLKASDYVKLINVGDQDANHKYDFESNAGIIRDVTDLYPSGMTGAKYNAANIPFSFKLSSSANCGFLTQQLESPVIAPYNESLVSTVRQIEILHAESALLQDDEIWGEFSVLEDSGKLHGTITDDAPATALTTPANQESSSVDWTEGLSERADSTAYSVDDKVKSVLSPGLVFIVTSISGTGTTAASPPAGFTGASQGDTITDNPGANQVVWQVMYMQKVSVTRTAAEQGKIRGKVVLAKPSIDVWCAARIT